jgi:hypothetical protein
LNTFLIMRQYIGTFRILQVCRMFCPRCKIKTDIEFLKKKIALQNFALQSLTNLSLFLPQFNHTFSPTLLILEPETRLTVTELLILHV